MTTRKKGLGRGLEALLGSSTSSGVSGATAVQALPIEQLRPGRYQPRKQIDGDALEELAASIRAQGMIQPIAVRPLVPGDPHEGYEIIAGERRYRAALSLALQEVPVVVHEVDDQAALAMALIENLQRQDLNAMEEAEGIARLIEDFGLTHEQAAKAVGRSRSATSNLLRLLQLPSFLQQAVRDATIDAGHARVLVGLPAAQQRAMLAAIAAEGLSVREVESRARLLGLLPGEDKSKGSSSPPGGRGQPPHVGSDRVRGVSADWQKMQTDLADVLGLPVVLTPKKKGGELRIRFSSAEEFDGLLERVFGRTVLRQD
jgi:ParB family transcriptional regulator, chromosome partitioning protein